MAYKEKKKIKQVNKKENKGILFLLLYSIWIYSTLHSSLSVSNGSWKKRKENEMFREREKEKMNTKQINADRTEDLEKETESWRLSRF